MKIRNVFSLMIILVVSGHVHAESEQAMVPHTNETVTINVKPVSPEALLNALNVAVQFLDAIDSGHNAPRKNLLSEASRTPEAMKEWSKVFSHLKRRAGKRKEAHFNRALKTSQLPSGIKGDFVVIVMTTEFDKVDVVETVILVSEEGHFRVLSYNYEAPQ